MKEDLSKTFARELLSLGAVLLRPAEPFTWASGWHSPIYCDNRRVLSSPTLRSLVAEGLAARVKELYPGVQVIAGVATGAIAHGVLAADRLSLPFVYVRSKPKDHGTGSQIEGKLEEGADVVVIEDLVSTGKSSLEAVRTLRAAGANVLGMIALFTYGFPEAAQAFEAEGVALSTLSSYPVLLGEALSCGYIRESDIPLLAEWRQSPSTWGR